MGHDDHLHMWCLLAPTCYSVHILHVSHLLTPADLADFTYSNTSVNSTAVIPSIPSTVAVGGTATGTNPTLNRTNAASLMQRVPPPITAFMGVPPPIQGSAATRRAASALRTLPQHQAPRTGQASTSRNPRRAFPQSSRFEAPKTSQTSFGILITAHAV